MLHTVRFVLLTALGLALASPLLAGETKTGHFPMLSQEQAWKHLPKAEQGQNLPLPGWARVLARSLPGTTAAMLELDYRHRVLSTLDPVLCAKMRWVAADANRSPYGIKMAEFDLRQSGVSKSAIEGLRQGPAQWSDAEHAMLQFAKKMTLAANTVTDEEVAHLIKAHGEAKTVAMVLLLAHANFQDRLLLALGMEPEEDMSPRKIRFVNGLVPTIAVPIRKTPKSVPTATAFKVADPEWRSLDFEAMQKKLAEQKGRTGRIQIPTWEAVEKRFPPETKPKRPVRIQWSLVCMGYQPELAAGWSACTRTFGKEANPDRVFEESLFWVVTRSLHCFY
jgi:alkylhydroperoxidase family enzyme